MFARLPAELLSNMVATTEFLYLFYFLTNKTKQFILSLSLWFTHHCVMNMYNKKNCKGLPKMQYKRTAIALIPTIHS